VTQPGQDLDSILLDLLAWTAPLALLAAAQIGGDRIFAEDESRRKPGHDCDEGRPVRLAGSHKLERHG